MSEIERRLEAGDEPEAVVQRLKKQGLSDRSAHELVAVALGENPDDIPPGSFEKPPIRPTGQETFDALSGAEQDELIGQPAAEKIRAGEATLADFIDRTGDFLTQKPAQDV